MGHSFLKELKVGDVVSCVYHANFKLSKINPPGDASNGKKFVILSIEDNSVGLNIKNASAFIFFDDDREIAFLKDDYPNRTSYFKIEGKCFKAYPDNIGITVYSIVPAGNDSDIVFDRSDLFPFNPNVKSELLSLQGKKNMRMAHTSVDSFQQDYDLIDIGTKLDYKRIYNSPHDRNQVDVIIPGINEKFSIPAYLSPTIGKMIDEGYKFDITVSAIPPRDEAKGFNAGIRVDIKGFKNDTKWTTKSNYWFSK